MTRTTLRRVVPALLTLLFTMNPQTLGGTEISSDAATFVGIVNRPLHDSPSPREVVMKRASRSGFGNRERACLAEIIHRESRWNPKADNPRSSAQGLFQMLKQKPNLPVEDQARLGLKYIASRYGTPCKALAFHDRNGWY